MLNTLSRFAFILTCGGMFLSLANAQGSIVSWGDDQYGQVSNTPSGSGFTEVDGGWYHSVALRADGSIVSWGQDFDGVVSNTPTGTGFVQVSAGAYHTAALRTDGSIVSWGHDASGQVSNSPSGVGFTQVLAGSRHTLALRADGSIAAWGYDASGQVSTTPGGTGYIDLGAGHYFSLALRADGSIAAWGDGLFVSVLQVPSGTGFTQVAGVGRNAFALHSDGTITNWGTFVNHANYPGTGYTQISAGGTTLDALHMNGSLSSWEIYTFGPPQSSQPGHGFLQVAGRGNHSVALRADPVGIEFCSSSTVNSAGRSAVLFGNRDSSIDSGLHLDVFQGTPLQLVYLLVGNEATGGIPISNGQFCLAGTATAQFFRYNVAGTNMNSISLFDGEGTMTNASGTSTTGLGFDVPSTIPSTIPATIMVGDTWHFQAWYRDTLAGSGSSNFSNGLSVTF